MNLDSHHPENCGQTAIISQEVEPSSCDTEASGVNPVLTVDTSADTRLYKAVSFQIEHVADDDGLLCELLDRLPCLMSGPRVGICQFFKNFMLQFSVKFHGQFLSKKLSYSHF